MAKAQQPDVVVDGIGESVLSFYPKTDAAREWFESHVEAESWQWFGGALCVDHRLAGQIIEGIAGDGLRVRVL